MKPSQYRGDCHVLLALLSPLLETGKLLRLLSFDETHVTAQSSALGASSWK